MSKSTSSSSRRAVLAGAIAMPIAAAVTVSALAEADDAELLRLAAYDGLGGALDALKVAETRWLKSNPAPDEESGRDWHEWAFGPRSGYDEADAAAGVASDKLHAAIAALNATPARTLRGLIVKVRLGEIDPDAVGNLIHPSIIADLRAMAAVGVA